MSNRSPAPIHNSLIARGDLIQLIVVGAILGVGINVLSTAISADLIKNTFGQYIFGITIITLCVVYLCRIVFRARQSREQFTIVIPYSAKTNAIASVPGYKLSSDLADCLVAVFAENKALEASWQGGLFEGRWRSGEISSPAGNGSESSGGGSVSPTSVAAGPGATEGRGIGSVVRVSSPFEEPKAVILLKEALEFCLIDKLSSHLSEHFNRRDDNDKMVKEYTRRDFPGLLLENRILSLLSTPFEDRAIFAAQGIPKSQSDGEIYWMMGADGAVYNRFHLHLPTGTTVTRPELGTLRLENSRIVLTISINYYGFSYLLPTFFEQYFLGVQRDELDPLQAKIELSITIKPWALLRLKGWHYYQWADSFAATLREYVSFDDYLERIGWSYFQTHLIVSHNTPKSHSKPKQRTPRPKPPKPKPTEPGSGEGQSSN